MRRRTTALARWRFLPALSLWFDRLTTLSLVEGSKGGFYVIAFEHIVYGISGNIHVESIGSGRGAAW